MKYLGIVSAFTAVAVLFSTGTAAMKQDKTSVASNQLIEASSAARSDRLPTQHSFTMVLPQRAGETFSMLSLSLQSKQSGAIPVPFDVRTAKVAVEQGRETAVNRTWIDETGTLWIEFKPALPPQTKLTLSLATHSLATKTSYEYGIAAYSNSEYPAAILVDSGVVTLP